MYSSFATQFFSLFACEEMPGQASRRLRGALDEKCFQGAHLRWVLFLALPFGLCVVLGLPLLAFTAVKAKLTGAIRALTPSIVQTYGFLFKYEHSHIYTLLVDNSYSSDG